MKFAPSSFSLVSVMSLVWYYCATTSSTTALAWAFRLGRYPRGAFTTTAVGNTPSFSLIQRPHRAAFSGTAATNRNTENDHGNESTPHITHNNQRLFPEDLNILYDSQCNVCQWEIEFLRRRDRRINADRPRLRFTDLESHETSDDHCYQPNDPANGGVDYATGMASIHGVTAYGTVLRGVPVFRTAYRAVKLGWLFALTTWPGLSWLTDRLYDVFARYRTRLTRGGATVPQLVEAYEYRRRRRRHKDNSNQGDTCATGQCAAVPPANKVQ